jgi:hypothetical protein
MRFRREDRFAALFVPVRCPDPFDPIRRGICLRAVGFQHFAQAAFCPGVSLRRRLEFGDLECVDPFFAAELPAPDVRDFDPARVSDGARLLASKAALFVPRRKFRHIGRGSVPLRARCAVLRPKAIHGAVKRHVPPCCPGVAVFPVTALRPRQFVSDCFSCRDQRVALAHVSGGAHFFLPFFARASFAASSSISASVADSSAATR